MAEENHWISEAVIDFLRGPLYINPLMAFIDERCLIFTPEDENKLEYTTIHEEFKQVVDNLLTEFLEEMGVTPETFYEIVSSDHNKCKLTSFVVQTILTVDDFLMFKTMMVKRNIDLTNQVLAAVDELRAATARTGGADQEDELRKALMESTGQYASEAQVSELRNLMRNLQLQDEDVAMAIAIAESLKDAARMESEWAELEQAIALSLALEAEQRRLAAARAAGALADQLAASSSSTPTPAPASAPAPAPAASSAAAAAARSSQAEPQSRPFPDPTADTLGPLPKLSDSLRSTSTRPHVAVQPLEALNVGPNVGAERLSAVAAAAAQAASMVASSVAAAEAGSGKFVPAPLNLPDKAPKTLGDVPAPDSLILGGARSLNTQSSVNMRAAGYKGPNVNPVDLAAIREAATAAAETQKNMLAARKGPGGSTPEDDAAQKWLQEAKLKLIAQKKSEREAETAKYKAEKAKTSGKVGTGAAPGDSELDGKRAALRDKLAQKFKQDLMEENAA